MSGHFRLQCRFEEIWGKQKERSPFCEGEFVSPKSQTLFCPTCRKVIITLENKNVQPDHPELFELSLMPVSPYPLSCELYPSMELQQMSVEKLGRLGKFGIDFAVLPSQSLKGD